MVSQFKIVVAGIGLVAGLFLTAGFVIGQVVGLFASLKSFSAKLLWFSGKSCDVWLYFDGCSNGSDDFLASNCPSFFPSRRLRIFFFVIEL